MFTKLKSIILLALITNLILISASILNTDAAALPNVPNADSFIYLPIITSPPGPIPFGPVYSGNATWYYATGAGNCSFPESPENMMVAAMNHTQYADSALCGAYAQVTGPDGTVIVRIVDRCPECPINHIDLSREAFAQIANLSDGLVPISWQLVSYPLVDPIVYHFKEGSNQWWTAVQIRNHTNPIVSVAYWDGVAFQEVPRLSYNYFVQTSPGMGEGPYTFRVTDYFGNQLIDNNIPFVEDGEVVGGGQFPQP